METYRASTLGGRTRVSAWNELYGRRVEKADWSFAEQERLDAEIGLAQLGPLELIRIACGQSLLERTPLHIGDGAGRTHSFILQTRSTGEFRHYGQKAVLEEGDFVLYDNAAPFAYRLEAGAEFVMLRTPTKVLREHLPSPDYFCGRRVAASEGLTDLAAALIRSVCVQLQSELSGAFRDRVARHLLDVIATSYAVAFDARMAASSNVSGWHAKVKLYIEQHLRDPDLSPCSIAAALKLSPRYVRMIFSSCDETMSGYILRRRLEECARQIADPSWSGHSITEIAFGWGFNSAPHFTRSFRERYQLSPREYRRERLGAGGASRPAWAPAHAAPAFAAAAG